MVIMKKKVYYRREGRGSISRKRWDRKSNNISFSNEFEYKPFIMKDLKSKKLNFKFKI